MFEENVPTEGYVRQKKFKIAQVNSYLQGVPKGKANITNKISMFKFIYYLLSSNVVCMYIRLGDRKKKMIRRRRNLLICYV